MRILAIIFVIGLISCTSNGVESVTDSVYGYDGVYLKKIKISGDIIYLRCDSEGRILGGTGEINISFAQGKARQSVAVINGEINEH